jgi:hypothetical protein
MAPRSRPCHRAFRLLFFVHSDTEALLEYFDAELAPDSGEEGQVVEAGHCFEWAWLFDPSSSGAFPTLRSSPTA